nr:MAG TPA: Major capsid protein [Microviridae sp.]
MSLFNMSAVKNHPRRSGFDLSNRVCFTSKAGELLPVFWDIVYPGDSFKIKTQLFTRTQPLNTAAYTRIREYLDFYFVPLRLINKNLPTALMQMQDNPVQATGLSSNKVVTTDIPWVPVNMSSTYGSLTAWSDLKYLSPSPSIVNLLGFDSFTMSAKLLMYLRYGNFLSAVLSDEHKSLGLSNSLDLRNSETPSTGYTSMHILPLAAYQKVYADFFRFTQWEKNQPYTYNFDWYSGGNVLASLTSSALAKAYYSDDNLFTLRYANWPKDMFMGVMPDSQLGEVSIVDASGSEGTFPVGLLDVNDGTLRAGLLARSGSSPSDHSALEMQTSSTLSANTTYGVYAQRAAGLASSFTILQLRMAEAVQKYREVSQFADQDARGQIMAHFGVSLSPVLSDKCVYLGGSSSNIDLSEVVNTNITGDNVAEIAGKGVGTGQGSFSGNFDEYGIIIGIYHSVPLLDYVITGQPQNLLYTNTADLPFPEFDSIGMQTIQFGRFVNSKSVSWTSGVDYRVQTMGYLPRFFDVKTRYDEVLGAFRSTLKNWVAPLDPSYVSKWLQSSVTSSGKLSLNLNYGFFKVNPRVLDSIFNVKCDDTIDTDQFLTALYMDIKAVRNFDYDGMPY